MFVLYVQRVDVPFLAYVLLCLCLYVFELVCCVLVSCFFCVCVLAVV